MVLKGHKYGIKMIKIEGDIVVSVGDENDKGVLVWEIITPRLLSANLMKNSKINGSMFINGEQKDNTVNFITFGSQGHLKMWTI